MCGCLKESIIQTGVEKKKLTGWKHTYKYTHKLTEAP